MTVYHGLADPTKVFQSDLVIFLTNNFVMLTTVKGIYQDGKVTLLERPKVAEPADVLVTFTEDQNVNISPKVSVFGYSKGTVVYVAPDFDEPMEGLEDYI